ncbi:hypothetical protein [Metabacillus arenae]|uniref:t-SNARE coiled-coil homology domain-containing protein n=1 Tax=Metabacillus arenae TaxID=2771434 RepID=A0A926NP73_9BACI|nr:hypothetical protein [Metabacillus arenae]MBD1381396.1 hypothetical protein [Metabacillus arenae]
MENKQIYDLLVSINHTIEQFEGRFDKIEERFNQVEKRFGDIDGRFDKVDKRFGDIDGRFDKVDKRFGDIEERFNKVDNEISEVKEIARRIEVSNEDDILAMLKQVQNNTNMLGKDVKYLSEKVGHHEMVLNRLAEN